MRSLRAQADAVMIGAGTLRAERLSLGLDENSPQPLAVILTASGDVPLHTNLILHRPQNVLVITTQDIADATSERLRSHAEVLQLPAAQAGAVALTAALHALERDYRIQRLLVEGGPQLNRALLSEELVDELFLTVAPKLLGGHPRSIQTLVEGALPAPQRLQLLSAYLASDELFLRYALRPNPTREA